MKKNILFLYLIASTICAFAQNPVPVGSGSYAEYPTPEAAAIDWYGQSAQTVRDAAPYYVHERMYGQPIPTNDWTTDIFFSQYCGEVWAYPHMITADAQGANIFFPSAVYVDGWGSQVSNEDVYLEVVGGGFAPGSAIAYDWNDIAFTMQCRESETEYINTTFGHGMPFVWAEYEGIATPQINASAAPVVKDISGNALTFPTTTSVFTLTYGGVTFGVHLPAGTTVTRAGNTFSFAFAGAAEYVVVSMLPAESFVSTFDAVARNKPTNTIFTYDYTPANGTVSTTFTLETENLDNQTTGGESILALMPHHWRNTTLDKTLIANAEYTGVFGTLKCVQGTSVQIDYVIPGMPAVMPAPNNLDQTQIDQLNALITSRVNAGVNAGNTYAKSLGEGSQMMLYAKELGHPGYESLKASLKAELIDWLTFTPGETTGKFFALYPELGAYVGFAPGYGSQVMNDHNFHNGYYIAGAARLMLVDEQFKAQYGEMVKKVAKSYANWLRYGVNDPDDDFLPFFRSLDLYTGHSWAGGFSGGEGPNQESTSESTNSWFGLYTLGLALDDPEIIKAGAMGFTLEGRATMEYWFDMYNDNYLPEYGEYTGIVFAGRLARGTWFSGDRGWVFGIQCVPNADFYQYYMTDATSLAAKWDACLQDRVDNGDFGSNDPYANVIDMGEYLGGYHINYVAAYDPEYAAQLLDQAMTNVGGQWLTGVNAATTLYSANANVSYGLPADGFTTDDYSSGVFYNATSGQYTYISSNYTDEPKTVVIYDNGTPIGHIVVEPNSISTDMTLNPGIPPTIQITSLTDNQNYNIGSDIVIDVDAADPDGAITEVQFWINDVLEFTDYTAPYTFTLSNVEESAFTVKAVAVDDDAIEATSNEYYLTVGNIPPSITITNPVSGTTYFVGDDVDITANASDDDGSIISVTFYENGVELTVDYAAPFTYSLVDLSLGNHSLQAIAVDNNGKQTVSDLVNIVALENCSGAPTTQNVGQFTYTISSATANPIITYIPTPGNEITFCQVFRSVNGGGEGPVAMTNNGDGTYSSDVITAGVGATIEFRFVNNFIGGGGEVFTHTIGENCGSNLAPVANAGADFSAKSTTAFINVDGSASMDWDGTIDTYAWSKISGPTATLTNESTSILKVEDLLEGVYVFELSVTDDSGAQSADQVTITVTGAVTNTPPEAIVDADFSVDINDANFMIDGSSSVDSDGTIASYMWTKENGPAATLSNENTSIVTVTGFEIGEYLFKLTVIDNEGAESAGYVTVTVFDPASNTAPVADAGADQTITLPTNSVSLDGTGSSDADGDALTYAWTQAAGPSDATISGASTATPDISNLEAGSYLFELTVNDGALSDVDQVTVTVEDNTSNVTLGMFDGEIFKVYPNPIVDQLIIECNAMVFNNLLIVDVAGNQLHSQKIESNELVIDMNHFSTGVYMIKLVGDTNTETKMIVKQ